MLVLLALALVWAAASPVRATRAAETGTIEGQLVGKNGAGKLGGTPVLLEIGAGAPRAEERRTTAADDGVFRIDNVPLASNYVYLLKVSYDGGDYYREVTFAPGTTTLQAPPIEVYPTTRSSESITFLRQRMLIVSVDDFNGIQVIETGAYRNGGDRAYIGPGGAEEARTLRFALPLGAGGLSPRQGLNRNTVVEATEGFATLEAIPPGEQQFAFSYGLLPQSTTLTLDRLFPYRTELFQIFVPRGIRLESSQGVLTDSGLTTLPNGQEFRLYTAQGLAPDTRLTVRLTNLPFGGGQVNPLAPAMAIFVLVLGLGLIVVYGRRRTLAPARAARATVRTVPGGRARVERQLTGNGAGDTVALLTERRRQLLLDLVELDEHFEAGGLPESDYRRQRAARKNELVGVLHELEASERQAP